MKPILFAFNDFILPSYHFMIIVGALAATFLAYRLAPKHKLSQTYILDLSMLSILFGFLGARIIFVLVEPTFEATGEVHYFLNEPMRFFYFWEGGFVSYGAYIGIILSCIIYLKIRRAPVLKYMDILSLSFPVAMFFGRMGCLLVGCCYGNPTDFWMHLIFSDPSSTAHFEGFGNMPLHATQIYMMLNQVFLGGILFYVYKKCWRFQGKIFGLLLIIYPILRFWVEFLRGDVDRLVYWPPTFSPTQIMIPWIFLVGIFVYFYARKKSSEELT